MRHDDQSAYEKYRQWCANIRIQPADFESWRQATAAIHPRVITDFSPTTRMNAQRDLRSHGSIEAP